MRKPLIIANWKMQLTLPESLRLARTVIRLARASHAQRSVDIAIAPSLENCVPIARLAQRTSIAICAQDCFWESKGAYTGEVSPQRLREIGCSHVLIGHSERRIHLGETDDMIGRKMNAVSAVSGLQPVLCIGEPYAIRRAKKHLHYIKHQLVTAFRYIKKTTPSRIIIAYEPVWAISTAAQMGESAPLKSAPDDCAAMVGAIKKIVFALSPKSDVSVLYGGSVTSQDVTSFVAKGIADGALIGGASLHSGEWKKIMSSISSS